MRTGIGGADRGDGGAAARPRRARSRQLTAAFAFLRTEVLGTRRKEIIRLFITEAGRFPEIAELYHREVLARGLALLRALAEGAVARGEFRSDALVRFPQLVVAPVRRRARLERTCSNASSPSTRRDVRRPCRSPDAGDGGEAP